MMTHTHTYALLPVSKATFDEIKQKLEDAGYDPDDKCIDMHGLALVMEQDHEAVL